MSDNNTKQENTKATSSADSFEFNLEAFISNMILYLKRFWAFVAVLVVIFSVGEYALARKNFVPEYKSSVSFAISTITSGSTSIAGACEYSNRYSSSAVSSQIGNTFGYILESDLMMSVIKADLNVSFLNAKITANAIESTNIFKVSVTSPSAQTAYDVVNSIVRNYPRVSDYVVGDTDMEIYVKPKLAQEPSNAMSWKKKVVIAAGVGGMLGLAVLAIFSLLRNTIKRKSDIKYKFNREVLAEIPYVQIKKRTKGKRIPLVISPRMPAFAEAYRTLKKRLLDNENNKVIAITSTLPGEGKTTVAFNLAYTLSMNGVKVALIDFDFQKNSIASFIETGDIVPGITDIDCKISKLDSIAYVNEDNKHLTIYPAGNIKTTVTVDNLSGIVDFLKPKFDYIIIDMPPCGVVAQAGIMTSLADQTLFVIKMDYASVSKIKNAVSYLSLCSEDFKIIYNGSASNNLFGGKKHYGYSYSSKYGSHYGKNRYGKKYGYGKSYGKGYGYGYGKGYGYGYGYGGYGKGYGYGYGYGGYGKGYGYGYGYGGYGKGYGYGYGYGGYGKGYGYGYGYGGYGEKHKHKHKSESDTKHRFSVKDLTQRRSKKDKKARSDANEQQREND